jgi:hypothetical protein
MDINNDFEISYLLSAFALLGTILVGNLLSTPQCSAGTQSCWVRQWVCYWASR